MTLLPRRAPIGNSTPIRGRSLAVIPVEEREDPGALPPSAAGQERLPALVLPGGGKAIAVLELSEEEAIGLGRALGQDEIFYWDGRRGRMVACR